MNSQTTYDLRRPYVAHHCPLGFNQFLTGTLPGVASGDCVRYALSDGDVLTYALIKTAGSWKIVTYGIDNPNA